MENEIFIPKKDDDNDCPLSDDIYNDIMYLLKQELNIRLDKMGDLACTRFNKKTFSSITKENDALVVDWHKYFKYGWLAPPYTGKRRSPFKQHIGIKKEYGIQPLFIQKAVQEAEKGMIIIALIQNNITTRWFIKLVTLNNNCHEIQMMGALKFFNLTASRFPTAGKDPSTLVIFGIKKGSLSVETHEAISSIPLKYIEKKESIWTTNILMLDKEPEETIKIKKVKKAEKAKKVIKRSIVPKEIISKSIHEREVEYLNNKKLNDLYRRFAELYVKEDRSTKKLAMNNAVKIFMKLRPSTKKASAHTRIWNKDLKHYTALINYIEELERKELENTADFFDANLESSLAII